MPDAPDIDSFWQNIHRFKGQYSSDPRTPMAIGPVDHFFRMVARVTSRKVTPTHVLVQLLKDMSSIGDGGVNLLARLHKSTMLSNGQFPLLQHAIEHAGYDGESKTSTVRGAGVAFRQRSRR